MIKAAFDISKNIVRRVERYIEIAYALKPASQTGQFFHLTFVCSKKKILAIGINNYHKILDSRKWGEYKPCKTDNVSSYRPGIHSEISALIKLGREDCSDLDFFNIRIGNNGEVMVSKPCLNCQRVLNQIGYKNIYYFDENKVLKRYIDSEIENNL